MFATESLAQTLRQMEAHGRDGLPVLFADGQPAEGWVTGASVLRAIACQISEGEEHADEEPRRASRPPPERLPGDRADRHRPPAAGAHSPAVQDIAALARVTARASRRRITRERESVGACRDPACCQR